jgi:hypothetical protein
MALLRAFCLAFLIAFSAFQVTDARAQRLSSSELLRQYLHARTAFLAERESAHPFNLLEFRGPETLYLPGDTMRVWLEGLQHQRLLAMLPEPIALFSIDDWEKISNLRSAAFEEVFDDTQWAFTGSNSRSSIDTMRTADLRSRFQTVFGAPTVTLVETPAPDSLQREQIVEFEYWFLLNDSVRVVVLDVNGPWDRGVVLAADQDYRAYLPVIKREFLEQLIPEADRTPFADYYYNIDQQTWYLTGFDGASFFDRRIERPDMSEGRPSPIRGPDPIPLDDPNEQE